ncbi:MULTISPECIES: AAA family ATPase [unclassified Candidatus Frackibacter]|uniref:AAA family ATPase n=1 Tax=unclassified Candidatus Frackibacter TaxID=2648818 RepID=UPI0007969B76|nr:MULTISPECIES: AAA family ATPase [unclassified Candidatus Frackibacter]KXS41700.1 MAG: hypothetical protein AWU54_1547 [Candidatus Frackibacter sp. T328-2]SDC37328.1 Uncharacterized protein YhaN [Candidatus Frackibacter sp. WG11]SEM62742.1 Uncharacterized protein YhaN [Candidatus Frackibacter sp. WG12]SFL65035.1 Uncharacterized protein YhaN [Candidatus Frackibacter sp. WG13]
MRIKEFHINGFGLFNDLYINDLSSGLVLFSGNNEAGKTTLMSFIRAVLYGFPRDISSNNRYEPLNGGKHGGALTFLDQQGNEYRVERKEGRLSAGEVVVYGPNGKTEGDKALEILLRGVSEQLYKTLFCFGLDELQKLENLQRDEVNNFIYSAGMSRGTRSIIDVREELVAKKEELYTPRGRTKPVIKNLLSELDDVEEELQDLMRLPQEYNQYQAEMENLKEEIVEGDKELNRITAEIDWLRKLKDALEPWKKTKILEKKLSNLADINFFPEAGIDRLEELKEEIEELKQRIKVVEKKREQKETELGVINIDKLILDNDTEIINLNENKELYLQKLDRTKELKNDLKHVQKEYKDGLSHLGSNWDEKKIDEFDLSVQFKGKVREYKQALEDAKLNLNQIEARIKMQKNNLQEKEFAVEKSKGKIEELKKDTLREEALLQQENELERLKEVQTKLEFKEEVLNTKIDERKQLQDRLNYIMNERKEIDNIQQETDSFISKNKVLSLFLASTGFFGLWQADYILGAVLIVIAFILLFMFKEEKDDNINSNLQHIENERERLEMQLGELDRVVADLKEEINNLQKEVKRIIGQWDINEKRIKEWEMNIKQERKRLDELEFLQKEYSEKEEAYRRTKQQHNNLKDKFLAIKKHLKDLKLEWKDWLRNHNLSEEISPDNLLDLTREVEKVNERLKSKRKIEDKLDHLEKELEEYQTKVGDLAKKCNLHNNKNVEYKVTELINKLKDNQERQEQKEELKEEISTLELELIKFTESLTSKNKKKNQLLSQGEAEDEEEFRKNATDYIQRQKLLDDLSEEDVKIKTLVKTEEKEARLVNDLNTYDSLQIDQKRDELEQAKQDLKQETGDKQERLGELREKITNLESSDKLIRLRNKQERLLTKLRINTEDWAIYAICERLIEMAKEKYEEERQPAVLKRASEYFRVMTKEKYQRVLKPLGEEELEIERYDGKRLTTNVLSKGTAEQLYLAMRISFVREYSKRVVPLPLIMDDILVNFDHERLMTTLEVIKQVAKEQQIIFFTCHSHLVEVVEKVVEDYQHYRLESGEVLNSSISV